MGYQALLFCPDEKTARTVTQILSELDFNVEACTEPFAAVKKLMGQHFDAVVVDCDNEQNATLLFKSARNSTSNQGSLAVAVVEGQAGVAKAFRIGANLVLTKPINIEQAKGTLRVARGLLRKGEPAKPGVSAAPAIPAPTKSVPSAKSQSPAAPASATPVPSRPQADAWPAPAPAASSKAPAQDDDLLDVGEADSVSPVAPVPAAPANKFITPAPQADKFLAAAVATPAPEGKTASNPAQNVTSAGGAASAPAPARERQDARVAEILPIRTNDAASAPKAAETTPSESPTLVGSAPTFNFGGANAPSESSGGSKKVFLGAAVAAVLVIAAYAGWAHFQGHSSEPQAAPSETITAPSPTPAPPALKPSGALHSSAPAASASALQPTSPAAKGHSSDNSDSSFEDDDISTSKSSAKSSSSSSSKTDEGDEPAAAPLIVRSGKAPVKGKTAAADAPAPSMLGLAAAGSSAPPDLGSAGVAPKPMLQTLNISQGVSRGLLFKKVQPTYPKKALSMRIEGSVELLATVSKTGDITHVKVLSGDAQLSQAAADAVKQWKYKPYLLNGEPVEIQTQVTINFRLPK